MKRDSILKTKSCIKVLGQELFEGVEVVSEIKRVAKNKANNCFCQMVDDARIISQKQLMGKQRIS